MNGQGGCLVEVKIGYPALGDAIGRRSPESWFESGLNQFDNVCPSFLGASTYFTARMGQCAQLTLPWFGAGYLTLTCAEDHVCFSVYSVLLSRIWLSLGIVDRLYLPHDVHHQHASLL